MVVVAEPSLLNLGHTVSKALLFHDIVLTKILKSTPVNSEAYNALIKSLKYALSVIVAGESNAGFRFMEKWARSSNKIDSILKSNLMKNRLKKYYPNQTQQLALKLDQK